MDGEVHTNGLENFWSLLKRAIRGTYVSVEPFHLFRYLDEQAFRFNNRKGTDAMRFALALKGIIGKRLTYTRSPARSCRKRAEKAIRKTTRSQTSPPMIQQEPWIASLKGSPCMCTKGDYPKASNWHKASQESTAPLTGKYDAGCLE